MNAVYSNRAKIVELLLLDPRVDPSANNNYAIQKAVSNGNAEIVEMLLTNERVDPSANGNYCHKKL
jgi:hypothetical protein